MLELTFLPGHASDASRTWLCPTHGRALLTPNSQLSWLLTSSLVLIFAACGNGRIPAGAEDQVGGAKTTAGNWSRTEATGGRGGGAGGIGGTWSGVGGADRIVAGSAGAVSTPASPYDYVQLAAGQTHNCARLIDGRVKCWGQNGGWLGLEDYLDRGDDPGEMGSLLPAVALGDGMQVDVLATRDLSTCVLLHGGQVKCWGVNSMGELGLGDVIPRGGEPNTMGIHLPPVELGKWGPFVEIAVGANHVCGRNVKGAVVCWGANDHGQLGRGDREARGDDPGEMGDALEEVDLGARRHALQVSAGMHHSCSVLDDYSVKCWGLNQFGQLGLGDIESRGDQPGEMGDALLKVELGQGQLARRVFAGADFSCAILEDQRVKCWGNNESQQLGNGSLNPKGDAGAHMGDALPYTDLGPDFGVKTLALGSRHACALSTNGHVKCWGRNDDGQLGIGTLESHGASPESMGQGLPTVDLGVTRRAMDITVGGSHSCAALDDGSVICWGRNAYGQLGIGNRESRGSSPSEMGSGLAIAELE